MKKHDSVISSVSDNKHVDKVKRSWVYQLFCKSGYVALWLDFIGSHWQ